MSCSPTGWNAIIKKNISYPLFITPNYNIFPKPQKMGVETMLIILSKIFGVGDFEAP